MSRTLRNISKSWCRKSPGTQQERRQFYAAKDQDQPVPVRGRRNLRHLPDSRAEIPVASERERIKLRHWLEKQVGHPWAEVLRDIRSIPTLKPTRLTQKIAEELILGCVYTHTFLRNGKIWATTDEGLPIELRTGLYVNAGFLRRV